MEDVTVISTKDFKQILERINSIDENLLTVVKQVRAVLNKPEIESGVTGFISIDDAASEKHFNTSRQTIFTKIKLWEHANNKKMDYKWVTGKKLRNMKELSEAMELKTPPPNL